MAAAARARTRGAAANAIRFRCCRSGSSSTTCAAALSRRRSRRCCCSDGPRCRRAWFWTAVVIAILVAPAHHCVALRPGRQASRGAAPTASGRGRSALRAGALCQARALARVSALRSRSSASTRSSARSAHARHPPAPAGMESVERRRSRAGAARPHGPARFLSRRWRSPRRSRSLAWIGICPRQSRRAGDRRARSCCSGRASPAIAWWISRPLSRRSARLTVDQTHFLRRLARKTWAYFETYVGPDDHWLPPDNVQEHPALKVAHRTSPTNMGLRCSPI